MATVTEDLAEFLAAQSTSWTVPTTGFTGNVFCGRLPDTPDTCITFIEVLGFEPPTETFGAAGTNFGLERPQIQVIARAGQRDYETGRNNAEWAYQQLRSQYGTLSTSSGTRYLHLKIRSSPYYQGEDDNSRHMFSFTIDVWKEPST